MPLVSLERIDQTHHHRERLLEPRGAEAREHGVLRSHLGFHQLLGLALPGRRQRDLDRAAVRRARMPRHQLRLLELIDRVGHPGGVCSRIRLSSVGEAVPTVRRYASVWYSVSARPCGFSVRSWNCSS
jgi:hypothetical protein